jgi:hypothetical protein
MAIANVSLDTTTRQAVLTIDGILISTNEFSIHQYVDMDEGLRISFSYTIENVNGQGLKERRRFFLPSPEELDAIGSDKLNENGFASKIVHDDDKAKADVINFFKQNRISQ